MYLSIKYVKIIIRTSNYESEQRPLTSATKLFMASRAYKAFDFNYNINVIGQKGWSNLAPGGLGV